MDLVESGAIFNFKPLNLQTSRDNGKDETLNSSSRSASKSHSRFEELFLASPRAQELISTIDQSISFTCSKSKINSPYKHQSFLHDSSGQTSLSTSNSDKSKTSLTCSGLVVNMLEFLKTGQQPRSQQNTLFSPAKDSDFDEDSLRTQVTDVISKLKTPVKTKSGPNDDDYTHQSLNTDSGFDERQMNCNSDSITDGVVTRSGLKTITSNDPQQCLPGSAVEIPGSAREQKNDSEHDPKADIGEPVEDEDIDVGEKDQHSNHIDSDSRIESIASPNKPKKSNEQEEENMECDLIPDISDAPETRDAEDENKKPLPAESTAQVQSNKKPHHLFGWYIKVIDTKNGPSIIVEGQRQEDPVGELWHSTAIVSRVSPSLVETKSKSQYVLEGEILAKESMEQGFSKQFVEAFNNGFPSNWKKLVQEHFDSILESPIKEEKQQKPKKTSSNKKPRKLITPKTPDTNGVKPIEVELKRTSSGRLVKPPLAWWRGQRIVTDRQHNLTAIDPGGEEHTALSVGLYDFDLKLPKSKGNSLNVKLMTPKVAKYEVTAETTSPLKNTGAMTKNKTKSAKENLNKKTIENKETSSYDGSESELTDSTSNSTKIKGSNNKAITSQAESDMSSIPGIMKPKSVNSDESWRPSESDSTAKESHRNVVPKSKKSQPQGNHIRLTRSRKQHTDLSTEGESQDEEEVLGNSATKEHVKRNISFSDDESNSKLSHQKSLQKKGSFNNTNSGRRSQKSSHMKNPGKGLKEIRVVLDKNQHLTRSRKQRKDRENLESDDGRNNKESDALDSSEDNLRGNALVKNSIKEKFKKPKGNPRDYQRKRSKAQSCTESSDEENIRPRRSTRKTNQLNSRVKDAKYVAPRTRARHNSWKNNYLAQEEEEDSLSSSDEEEAEAVSEMLSSVRQRREDAKTRASEMTSDTDSSKKKLRSRNTKNSKDQRSKSHGKQEKIQKGKDFRKEDGNDVDERDWRDDEIFRLSEALHSIPLSTHQFWKRVSDSVQTRTAQECQLKYDEQLNLRPRKVVKPKEKQPKPYQKVEAITGGVGTMKRKRELRQLIQQNNDGYEDDIFESTPYRSTQKKFKFLDQYSDDDNDDDDESDGDDEQHNHMDFKTPSSRTPSNRYRPLGPANSSSNTPTSDFISPSLLQPVNREGTDLYLHRMKQSKRGVGQYRKQDKMKVVTTSTPKKFMTSVTPKAGGSMFDVQEVLEQDSDEENEYYWSDE